MKDRVVLLTSGVLVVTVDLFACWTWARWGVVGIYPALGWLVVGAACLALAAAGLFRLSRTRAARVPQRTLPAAPPSLPADPGGAPSEEPEKVETPVAAD
ncbi:MAG: hypothetical protein WBW84_20505 [Acidobacteriaceae bacterium]